MGRKMGRLLVLLASGNALGWVGTVRAVDVAVPSPGAPGFAESWEKVRFRHDLWGRVLATHVDEEGLVDYASIGKDKRYLEYLYRLAHTDPRGLVSSDAKLAYWLNAYNAFAIQGVLETLPIDAAKWGQYSVLSVEVPGVTQSGKGFFVGLKFLAGGERYSLDEIEKAVLLRESGAVGSRAKLYDAVGPATPDARIHMALVCAARGCPKLSRQAFEESTVDNRLSMLVRAFTEDSARCRFDLKRRVLEISQLAKWYTADFSNPAYTPRARSVTDFFARFVAAEPVAASLRKDRWKISYLSYDWRLNVQR